MQISADSVSVQLCQRFRKGSPIAMALNETGVCPAMFNLYVAVTEKACEI